MAYYIISFDPDLMGQFQDRHAFLKNASWIKDKNHLLSLSATMGDDSFVFVHFNNGPREILDEMVLGIREHAPAAKLIYVRDKVSDEKTLTHKLTPVGGDNYISIAIPPQELLAIVKQIQGLSLNPHANRLENQDSSTIRMSEQGDLSELTNHLKSIQLDNIFAKIASKKPQLPKWQSTSVFAGASNELEIESGVDMSDKDQDLPLDDLGDLEITEDVAEGTTIDDGALDFDLDQGAALDIADEPLESAPVDEGMDLSLDGNESDELTINEDGTDAMSLEQTKIGKTSMDALALNGVDEVGDLNDLGDLSDLEGDFAALDDEPVMLGDNDATMAAKKSDLGLSDNADDLDFRSGAEVTDGGGDLSDDARKKLKEIDAIMDLDASQASIKIGLSLEAESLDADAAGDSDIDQPLVSDDLNLDTLDFGEDLQIEDKTKKRKAPVRPEHDDEEDQPTRVVKLSRPTPVAVSRPTATPSRDLGSDLKEISGAYNGEMERTQATISNLRADREELLAKIEKMEEEKTLQSRQNLSLRAELDEKKIELSIIRKKLNDEITDLRDRMKLHDEKRMILEEKNRVLTLELDKAAQKNKIDVKKVQLREKELEQKLELLKSDAEVQIRNRDHKILDLKRKLDSMEFDIESISVQEKRSVESRFELEDKLDKAIKTLRSAITVLESESEKSGVLEALKKNIDM